MPLNINIPHFYARVTGIGTEANCIAHAARSRAGKILTFHVLLDCGAHYSLLPLHLLSWKEGTRFPVKDICPWDCFSDDMEVVEYSHFKFKKVYVMHLGIWGEYLMSFDWKSNSFSDYTPEYKQGHLIKLDNGQFGLFPNNYFLLHDKSFTGDADAANIPKLHRLPESEYVSVETIQSSTGPDSCTDSSGKS